MRLRKAGKRDVPVLLHLINGYAARNLLLRRSEESLRERLQDFVVAEEDGEVVGCAALTELGPGLGEVRSLAVRQDQFGKGIGHAIALRLMGEAASRGFTQLLALTRRVHFFEALGFTVTRRELFLDKLQTDCNDCPLNLCCDETAVVWPVPANGLNPETVENRKDVREALPLLSLPFSAISALKEPK